MYKFSILKELIQQSLNAQVVTPLMFTKNYHKLYAIDVMKKREKKNQVTIYEFLLK